MMPLNLSQCIALATPTGLHAGLADFGPNQVVPLLLMTAGVLMLGLALRRVPAASPPPAAHPPAADPRAVEAVIRDAEELAALLAAQMDRQGARLERLIEEADARIRRLERLAATPERGGPARPSLHVDATDPLNRRVYELADEGLPPVEIARALSQQTGKVELILALRQR